MTPDTATRPLEVLICGGGIAGQALAHWLAKAGHRPLVVERFPALRAAGAQVDLRGQGIEAAKRMGVFDAIREHLVDEAGVAMVDERGRRLGTVLANRSGRGRQSLTSEFEIMRGDLVRILHAAASAQDGVEHRFGVSVDRFEERDERVTVHLSDGTTREVDLLVGADGQGSRIRSAIAEPDAADPYRRFGLHMAYWSVPRTAGDGALRDAYSAPGGRLVWRRSPTPTESQPYFVLRERSDEASAVHRRPVEQQKVFWADRFQDAGWQVPRFIDGMAATSNFYSQEALQVRLDAWSRGRVVLLGDAAHCASPFSGMGVSGALVGAYVLAGEISRRPDDLPQALAAYDRTLRPFVETVQDGVDPRTLQLGMPRSRAAVRILRVLTAVACGLRIPALVSRLAKEDRGGDWRLPEYEELRQRAAAA